jgi:hypothetical protein
VLSRRRLAWLAAAALLSGNTPSQAGFATVRLNCRFVSTRKATGSMEIAEGICRLTNVYEDHRWRLCDSRFDPPPGVTTHFTF